MQGASSTNYTSSFAKPGSAAATHTNFMKYGKQNGTILSSNDSAEKFDDAHYKGMGAAERYGIGSTDIAGKVSDP